jgi:phage terminase large subunit-like protein
MTTMAIKKKVTTRLTTAHFPEKVQKIISKDFLSESDELELKRRELEILRQQLKDKELLPHLYGMPWYKWAWDFFKSENRENFLCAANQISKSSTMIRKAIHWATAPANEPDLWLRLWPSLALGSQKPNQFWYFYPTFDVAQTEFETKWEPLFLPRGEYRDSHPVYGWKAHFDKGQVRSIEFNSGVTIYFKAYSQKPRDLQTGTVYAMLCDEEMPVDLLPELQARLNATDGYFHMVFTATLGQLYWEQTIQPASKADEKHADAWKRQVSIFDCMEYVDGTKTHWTEAKIKRVIAKCPTQAEIDRRVYGKFVKSSGLKLPTFDYDLNTSDKINIPKHFHVYAGVDPGTGGTAHPAAICMIHVSPDYKFGFIQVCWRGDGVITASPDIYQKYRELRRGLEISGACYDHAAREFFLHVSSKGESFVPANKDREAGYGLLNTLFRARMLKIIRGDQQTEKLISEIRSLPDKGDKTKLKDDLVDAMRYAAISVPWNLDDIEFSDEIMAERPGEKVLSSADERKEWFQNRNKPEDSNDFQEEFDYWNEMIGN